MARLRRHITLLVGGLILVLLIYLGSRWHFPISNGTPSNIVDFQPSSFEANADSDFFYSIGDELKNSNHIDSKAQTLLRGKIEDFLVSPDNSRIAVVANENLVVVSRDGSRIRQVAPVDSIYKDPKPIGRQFFRDEEFQWSRDSKDLYLIKDEYYESKGSQVFSSKGELWRYSVEDGNLQMILKPFPADSYFLGLNSAIYFDASTDSGAMVLKYFDGNRVIDIDSPDTAQIPINNLAAGRPESPFFSFSILEYSDRVLSRNGMRLTVEPENGPEKLEIGGKPLLEMTQGQGMKGSFYCSEMLRSVFLPGDRYFVFNASGCGNYDGQLLFDTQTGKYLGLPKDTRVYLTVNTISYPHYRITVGGILAE